jgi:hypothetical protein
MCPVRFFARLVIWCLSLSSLAVLSACKHSNEPDAEEQQTDNYIAEHIVEADEMIILTNDSSEWHIRLLATGLLYAEAVQVPMTEPWKLPTREEARVLKDLVFPNDERFVTSDGYTFGMPSASVTKAGQKTKYSVLGLWIRKTSIDVTF